MPDRPQGRAFGKLVILHCRDRIMTLVMDFAANLIGRGEQIGVRCLVACSTAEVAALTASSVRPVALSTSACLMDNSALRS
ncbi:hypothetical protein [Kibdelosporangium philippinense]|uniref:hypothetical protein n=1 Tax=Kibdelosporangium philippinense TaxID=211113 RepID=UPI0036102742